MTDNVKKFYNQFEKDSEAMGAEWGELLNAFGGVFKQSMKPGALDEVTKELIAVGMSLVLRCEPCIYLHVKKSLAAGATREQIIEAAGVAVMMQGGPGYTYLPKILHALEACEEQAVASAS